MGEPILQLVCQPILYHWDEGRDNGMVGSRHQSMHNVVCPLIPIQQIAAQILPRIGAQ